MTNWEKEIKKLIYIPSFASEDGAQIQIDVLIGFIRQLLQQQRAEILEILEKELQKWNGNGEYYDNVTKALSEAIAKIKAIEDK